MATLIVGQGTKPDKEDDSGKNVCHNPRGIYVNLKKMRIKQAVFDCIRG